MVGAVGVHQNEDIFLGEVWVGVKWEYKRERKGRAPLLIFLRVARGEA
jgi:hypothetical protein